MKSSKKTIEGDFSPAAVLARIESVRRDRGLNKAEFCRLLGYDSRRYGNLFSRGDTPSLALVQRIALLTHVDARWLLCGEYAKEGAGEGLLSVPVLDIRLSAGHGEGLPARVKTTGSRTFDEPELRQLTTNPHNLNLVKVVGTSMEPLLHAGDEVMIDTTTPITLRDGLHPVRVQTALMVKHLQVLTGGRIRLVSENPAYQPLEIVLGDELEDFAVIGRVVWGARRY